MIAMAIFVLLLLARRHFHAHHRSIMHRVSDHLAARHPYLDKGFTEAYDPKEVHRAFGNRVIPKYAELLVLDDLPDEDRARALADLRELLSNQELKSQAVDRELLFACADLTASPSLEVRENAALAIAALVLHNSDPGSDELSTEAMLRAATTLLADAEQRAVIAGCIIFQHLTVSNEGALLLASRLEIVDKITGMVNSQPLKSIAEPVVRHVFLVLANLTRVFEGAQACAECAITSPVLGVLKKCTLYDAETVHCAALILLNAATHDQGKRIAIHHGGVEVCLKVLSKVLSVDRFQKCTSSLHDELLRCLVAAVMALSTVEDAKPRVVEYGVEPLTKCLHYGSKSIKHIAMIAINSACEAPKGVAAFVDKLLAERELLVEVLGVKSIPALLSYLRNADGDDDAKLDALATLADLIRQQEDAAHQIVQTLHLIEVIVELAVAAANGAVRDEAMSALKLLVARGDKYQRRVGKALLKGGASSHDFALIVGVDMATFASS